MAYGINKEKINDLQKKIVQLREEIVALRNAEEAESVTNYSFQTSTGETVSLGELFGDKDELMMIHNMGASCVYCTLWADGFNGVLNHLENRAAFVVSSPDSPEQQKKFAESRDWKFKMVSTQGTSFAQDMNYADDSSNTPGISVFRKDGDKIFRVSDETFGPGDDYCHIWHMFDLLPAGKQWAPQYRYN